MELPQNNETILVSLIVEFLHYPSKDSTILEEKHFFH